MKKSDSESERDEDHKRKREEGRESEERINPFRKSKKVERSPVKKAMDQEMKKMLEKNYGGCRGDKGRESEDEPGIGTTEKYDA
jgi:DNA replicative helicase MCM subunit Mcm2 (Cdc46/Mcm family)